MQQGIYVLHKSFLNATLSLRTKQKKLFQCMHEATPMHFGYHEEDVLHQHTRISIRKSDVLQQEIVYYF